jgi:hypothetical protein
MSLRTEDLTKMLSETLGNEAFEKAAAEDALLGNPPARSATQNPPVAAQPAAPAAPQADPVSAPAAPSPQQTSTTGGQPAVDGKMLLGKYKTEAEAEKGYFNLLQQNKVLLSQLDKFKEAPPAPAPTFTAPAQPEKADPSLQAIVDKFSQFEEVTGIPKEEIHDMFATVAKSIAKETARQTYTEIEEPRKRLQEADDYMATRYPESTKFQDEIVQFTRTNPEVNSVISELWGKGLYKEAMQHGYMAWKLESGVQQEHALTVAEEVRRNEVEAARQDAGLLSTQAQGARESVNVGPSPEEMAELIRISRAGNNVPFLRATIGRTLSDDYFAE